MSIKSVGLFLLLLGLVLLLLPVAVGAEPVIGVSDPARPPADEV